MLTLGLDSNYPRERVMADAGFVREAILQPT